MGKGFVSTLRSSLLLLSVVSSLFATPAPQAWAAGERCEQVFAVDPANVSKIDEIRKNVDQYTTYETSKETLLKLLDFAQANHLPVRSIELGPDARRVKRVFVALDATDDDLVQRYLDVFNLNTATGAQAAGTLPLEFQYEKVDGQLGEKQYVTGVLRPTNGKTDQIYRWGRKDLTRDNWWSSWVVGKTNIYTPDIPILAYGHLLGLNKSEVANVQYFLDHPEERGFCKSTNCVAWTSGIELGKTVKGSTDEEREYLFSQLGMARASAHFEIMRRLVHAANDRHVAIVTFVRGQEGYNYFKQADSKLLPDMPKTALPLVVRGLDYPDDGDLMTAIKQIPDGSKIFIPIAAGASPEGVAGLVQQAPKLAKGYEVHVLVNGVSEATMQKGIETPDGKFRVKALFLGGNLRKAYREGKVDVIPGYLSDFTRTMMDPEQTEFHYDAIIVRVAPKDAQGRYSLGANNDMILSILKARPNIKVIAEINPNVPNMDGDNYITDEQITAKFESRAALAGPPKVPFTPVEEAIGANIGKLIPSEAYLQMGIGNVFDGVPSGLVANNVKKIKIWSEMFGDPLFTMITQGVASSAEAGFAYGSGNMYQDMVRYRQYIKFIPTEVVNAPGTIASMPKFHAINTALQVNLRGDTNATHGADGMRISSPGGQVEFMSGAARSAGGKAIIAIRSTAREGTLSTIVLDTYAGSVTTPHESVTHVVTEYGTAQLVGKSESQRAVALINIAHPKFRQQLMEQALARKMISAKDVPNIKLNAE